MPYEEFLCWCIDTSRDDRDTFVNEIGIRLNALLRERTPSRKRPKARTLLPTGRRNSPLKLAMKSVKSQLTK